MDLDQIYGTNKEEEISGVWIPQGDGRVRIARAGGANKKFISLMKNRVLKPYKRQMEQDIMDEEVSAKLMREIYADSILLGWEGITVKGEDVPYSRENVIKLFTDFPDFFRSIRAAADEMAVFRNEEIEATIKNSPAV